jgi:putative oxidoreductase
MNSKFGRFLHLLRQADALLDRLAPLFLLGIRLYVAHVFFKSGLTKINDFSSTIALFESEYKVPILPPDLAAYAGTAAELVLPILFAAGIFSRPVAISLFLFNLVAMTSYPDISDVGRVDHLLWGALILVVVFFGAGRFSMDQWLQKLRPTQS